MEPLKVEITKVRDGIDLPTYAHEGDSGLDLRAAEDITLAPFERVIVPCGFSIAIPVGYGGFVLPRSGLASKKGITVANAPGLIDSGYRGEVMVALVNLNADETFRAKKGERIAQLVIMPTPPVSLAQVEELEETQRGVGGFGSSGTL